MIFKETYWLYQKDKYHSCYLLPNVKIVRIMCTNGIRGQVLINTLHQYPRLTLHRHLGWHSITTPSTSWSTVGWQLTNHISINAYESVNTWPAINWLLIKCRLSVDWDVDWVLIKMLIESINWQMITDAVSTHDPIVMTNSGLKN